MSNNKFGPDRFSRFDVYWIKKKQTPKLNLYIDRYIVIFTSPMNMKTAGTYPHIVDFQTDNQKTAEEEDDIIEILKRIRCCYQANSFILSH